MKIDGISVIIPTFNRANKIRKSVESVLNQTYKNLEVIIVDDNSTDNTKEVLDDINDGRIVYYKLKKNKGPSYARNIGVGLANYQLIAFQDSDDYWEVDKLEIQLEKLKSDEEIALVYSPYKYVKNGKYIRIPSAVHSVDSLEKNILTTLFNHNVIGTPTILMKKSVFNEVGGFDNNIEALEDWDLALRVALKYKIGYIKQDLVCAYYSENSVNYNMLNTAEAFFKILNKYPKTYNYNNMQNIYRYIATIKDNKEMNKWKERLIPKYINDENSLNNILFLTRKLEELKYSESVTKFINNDNKIQSYMKNNGIEKKNSIVIYGATDIGVSLYCKLKSYNFQNVYITDTNYVYLEDVDVKRISQIPASIDYVIVTIRKNIDCSFVNRIWKNIKVLNIFDSV